MTDVGVRGEEPSSKVFVGRTIGSWILIRRRREWRDDTLNITVKLEANGRLGVKI
jgi:hypothetical protein